MKEILKLAGILTLITGIAASALSNVYLLTRDRIAAVESEKEASARRIALPQAVFFTADSAAGGFVFWRGWKDSTAAGDPAGYVVPAYGRGYSSTVRTMVGVDTQMKIAGIKVAFQQETPGLGTRMEEVRSGEKTPWFQEQFKGKTTAELEVTRGRDPQKIEAITGATISSRAVATSVREAIGQLQQALK